MYVVCGGGGAPTNWSPLSCLCPAVSSLYSPTQQSATASFQQLVTDTQNYRGSSWNQVHIVENVQIRYLWKPTKRYKWKNYTNCSKSNWTWTLLYEWICCCAVQGISVARRKTEEKRAEVFSDCYKTCNHQITDHWYHGNYWNDSIPNPIISTVK